MGKRQAVTIGVSGFSEGPDGISLDELDYAPDLAKRLGDALGRHGYETVVVGTHELTSGELGQRVKEQFATVGGDDVLLVHVLSHGHAVPGSLHVLGSDGRAHPDTDIDHWLKTVQNVEDQPLTLFLLDLCSAGTTARLPWQTQVEAESLRGWVIAASKDGEAAYDGRLTQAVINVLAALGRRELDIDPSRRHVPLRVFARAVRQEVNRLRDEADSFTQRVTVSQIEFDADPDLPFFPNPAYAPDRHTALRAALDPSMLPFLQEIDEGLDAQHFLDRAAGSGRLSDGAGLVGCFTGRAHELRALSPWLNGFGPGRLAVVTGSPGAGKSALLGLLVCAAHPVLREPTQPLWNRRQVAQLPNPIEALAAVHTRRRTAEDVAASIARQLGLPAGDVPSVVAAVRARAAVVVLDALDESDDPADLMARLVLPLTGADGEGRFSPARVLVGVRPYDQFEPMLAASRASSQLYDLDEVSPDVLEEDLYLYVRELLQSTPVYRPLGSVSGGFASRVAGRLAQAHRERQPHWGAFLVAGLYTRHLVGLPEPVRDSARAEALGDEVPLDLPGVLRLDLEARPDEPWLAPVLRALAHGKGQGMPISVVTRIAGAFGGPAPDAAVADSRRALESGRFYLRQSVESDGSTLYRLFHQGLVDHLVTELPPDPREVFERLLAPLGPPGARDWSAAEPYLFRHALEHADEAGRRAELTGSSEFLLHPDAAPALAELTGDGGADPVLRLVLAAREQGEQPDRGPLALAALRAGLPDLVRTLVHPPGGAPLAWRPAWIRGTRQAGPELPAAGMVDVVAEPVLLAQEEGPIGPAAISADGSVAAYVRRDGSVVVREADGKTRTLGIATVALAMSPDGQHVVAGGRNRTLTHLHRPSGRIRTTTGLGGEVLAVHVDTDRERILALDSAGGVFSWSTTTAELIQLSTLTMRGWSGRSWVFVTAADGRLHVVSASGSHLRSWGAEHSAADADTPALIGPVTHLAAIDHEAVVVLAAGQLVQVPLQPGGPPRSPLQGTPANALAVAPGASRSAAIGADGRLEFHSWFPKRLVAGPALPIGEPTSLALSDQGHVLVGCRDGKVWSWGPSSGTPAAAHALTSVAVTEDVVMPSLGESVTEGTVTLWLKTAGDPVEVDEPLLEVATDKVDTEIPSTAAGVVLEILVDEDETVEVGGLLARIVSRGTAEMPAVPARPGYVVGAAVPPSGMAFAQDSPAEPPMATVVDADGALAVVDLRTGSPLAVADLPAGSRADDIGFEQIGSRLAVTIHGGDHVWVWSPEDDAVADAPGWHRPPRDHEQRAATSEILDGRLVTVVAMPDGSLHLFDESALVRILPGRHLGAVTARRFGRVPGRPTVVSGDERGRVLVHDVRAQTCDVVEVGAAVDSVDLAADGTLLVVAAGELVAFRPGTETA